MPPTRSRPTARQAHCLPVTFYAFHALRYRHYLHYARERLGSSAGADSAVRRAFGELATTWPEVLRSDNHAAVAWQTVKRHIAQEDRGRTAAAPPHHFTERQQDVAFLDQQLRYTAEEIADLLGTPLPVVRALMGRRLGAPRTGEGMG